MSKKENPCLGPTLKEVLEEFDILEEVQSAALKTLIKEDIKKLLKHSKMTISTLAEKAGISPNLLQDFLNTQGSDLSLDTLTRIALALNKRLSISFESTT